MIVVTPNPEDRLSGYAIAWGTWVLAFAVIEAVAIHQDAKHHDRVKRTLTANIRYVTAWDSVNGLPLRVPYGKWRRLAFVAARAWIEKHIEQPGSM